MSHTVPRSAPSDDEFAQQNDPTELAAWWSSWLHILQTTGHDVAWALPDWTKHDRRAA